jgi:hypothetical protein
MIVWVAAIIACSGPAAVNCQSLVKPEAFYSQQTCLEEVEQMLGYLNRQGVLSTGNCVAVDIGESA